MTAAEWAAMLGADGEHYIELFPVEARELAALLRRAARVEEAAELLLFDAAGNCNCADYAPLRAALEEK